MSEIVGEPSHWPPLRSTRQEAAARPLVQIKVSDSKSLSKKQVFNKRGSTKNKHDDNE
jgi:hypothetical protein